MIVQISGRASPSVPKKSKLPPRPDDYDEYWYQDESGEWRNEYDDEGRAQHKDVNSVIEIKISRARVEKLKHLTRAGGKLARTIAGVGSADEVFSGIKNVIRGAKQLGSGSALANEFRKVSAELKKVKIDINNYVKLL